MPVFNDLLSGKVTQLRLPEEVLADASEVIGNRGSFPVRIQQTFLRRVNTLLSLSIHACVF